jgi:hypothetical protein
MSSGYLDLLIFWVYQNLQLQLLPQHFAMPLISPKSFGIISASTAPL